MRGRPPRWRDEHNPTLVSLVDMFAEPVPDLPDVPAELTALLRRGMANDPAARPSAAELRDELPVHRDPDPTMRAAAGPDPRRSRRALRRAVATPTGQVADGLAIGHRSRRAAVDDPLQPRPPATPTARHAADAGALSRAVADAERAQ